LLNYTTLKKILFKLNPETAHSLGEFSLQVLPKISPLYNYMVKKNFIVDYKLSQTLLGIHFENPVGLAAGFDKNATMIPAMKALGFGFTEIGTMTPKPQEGNPKPRLFRHKDEKSLQNAMGFNNDGSAVVAHHLKQHFPFDIPIGANIGKNKNTPQEEALNDYKILIEKFESISDYLVINISSPNTPNLRDLQNETFINALFSMAKELTKKPIFLKIAPDMQEEAAIELCKTAVHAGASGIIATNTTIDYSLVANPYSIGGLSGEVLRKKSYTLFKAIAKELFGQTVLISAGGISDAKEAYKRLKAGASLVQCYTGLIYEGPSMVRNINLGLLELMQQDGFKTIDEVIGSDLK
jgi:dihydroorotate dehydrogenase